jgi:hypothetical protein
LIDRSIIVIGTHPNRIACREVTHVAIMERALKDQRHGLEASVGMRPADLAKGSLESNAAG